VVIRSSSAREIEKLVAQLSQAPGVERDAAIARLTIIGARAIDRLAALAASNAHAGARTAALRALEGIDDPRALDTALGVLTDPDAGVMVAAIGVAGKWVTRADDTNVLDALTAVALDRARETAVRLAALDALSELPATVVQPVLQRAGLEISAAGAPSARFPARWGGDAQVGPFHHPAAVREWLAAQGAHAPLSALHHLITRIREHERNEPSGRRRQEWHVARAAAHAVLARRGSRVALYDLRETFDGAQGPLPLDLLHAVTRLGDASCLEPLARAWTAAAKEKWWRDQLAKAARGILSREKLTARHAAVRRIRARFPGFL
jgi:hypothetical protein